MTRPSDAGTTHATGPAGDDAGASGPSTGRRRVFDIRAVIGAVFAVYGVLVGAAGIAPDPEGLVKSQGININLWTGLAMLVVAALFGTWLWLRPLVPDTAPGGTSPTVP